MTEVLDETLGRRDRVVAGGGLPRGDLFEDLAERLLTTTASLHRAREIVGGESIERRDGKVVDMPRVRRQGHRGEERNEETDLGALVQLTAAREMRRDLSLRKGVEERRRVGVVSDENCEVTETPLPSHGFARDQIRDGLGFLDAGHLLDVIDVHRVRGLSTAKALVDAEGRLEPLGVLGDEPICRVQ